LELASLSSSNIYIDVNGCLKICKISSGLCGIKDRKVTPYDSEFFSSHVKSLQTITMELMQGYSKENGAVGIDDLNRWQPDSKAVQFLSDTTSSTIQELRNVSQPW
jgi:hypothetical protein